MRRRRPERRTINPDPKFNDLQISKFMNYLLTDGKKGIAEKILYDAFDIVQDKSKKDPIDIFTWLLFPNSGSGPIYEDQKPEIPEVPRCQRKMKHNS